MDWIISQTRGYVIEELQCQLYSRRQCATSVPDCATSVAGAPNLVTRCCHVIAGDQLGRVAGCSQFALWDSVIPEMAAGRPLS